MTAADMLIPHSRTWRDKRVLIVTAHPDDEVMFFSPTILALVGMGIQIYALCLSIGNADNLGHIRRQELLNSYDRLGVSSEYVKSVDDLRLQDGMTIEWDEKVITEHIRMQVKEKGPFDAIITFDEQGISGHANHLACYRAINVLSQSSTFSPSTSFYTLHTIPVGLKYLSLPLAIARQILPSDHTRRLRFLSSFREYLYAVRAMTAHASQLVWFRYLYITASVYMYNNELIKV
jgi:N-acetylglucosaminylphosphatidylinositol deacetylase